MECLAPAGNREALARADAAGADAVYLGYAAFSARAGAGNFDRKELEEAGLRISGVNPEQDLAEIVEIPSHPYFIGCQFHPEFKSRPMEPHPLFDGLIRAALKGK